MKKNKNLAACGGTFSTGLTRLTKFFYSLYILNILSKKRNSYTIKMFLKRIKYIIICIGLAIFFVSIVIPSGVSYAQRRVKPEWVLPEHYPYGFDGWGQIDVIADDEIVIDDSLYKLSPSVEYSTPTEKYATRNSFSAGKIVGFITNSKREIVSLWLIE